MLGFLFMANCLPSAYRDAVRSGYVCTAMMLHMLWGIPLVLYGYSMAITTRRIVWLSSTFHAVGVMGLGWIGFMLIYLAYTFLHECYPLLMM